MDAIKIKNQFAVYEKCNNKATRIIVITWYNINKKKI